MKRRSGLTNSVFLMGIFCTALMADASVPAPEIALPLEGVPGAAPALPTPSLSTPSLPAVGPMAMPGMPPAEPSATSGASTPPMPGMPGVLMPMPTDPVPSAPPASAPSSAMPAVPTPEMPAALTPSPAVLVPGAPDTHAAVALPATPAAPVDTSGAPTKSDADALVNTVNFAQRTELLTQVDQVKHAIEPIMQKLEELKSTWYGKYLGLDTKLDDFYQQMGLGRGSLTESIAEIIQNLVAEAAVAAGQSPDESTQKQATETKAKLQSMEQELVDVSRQEQLVIDALRKLSEEVDKALDLVIRVNTKTAELRGIESDEAAKQCAKDIADAKTEMEQIEKKLQDELVKQLDKAFVDTEARLGPLQQKMQALEAEGIKFVAKAKAIVGMYDSAAPRRFAITDQSASMDPGQNAAMPAGPASAGPQLPEVVGQSSAPQGTESAPTQEEGDKKKRQHKGGLKTLFKGSILEQPYKATSGAVYKVWNSTQSARYFLLELAQDIWKKIVQSLRMLFGAAPLIEDISGGQYDDQPKSDPVLETIRLERNQAYTHARNLVTQRQAIEQKEKLLDRLETERIMQLDGRDEIFAELDSSYRRTSKELSWWAIAKRIWWKVHAIAKRFLMPVRDLLFGVPSKEEQRTRQEEQYVPLTPSTEAPKQGEAEFVTSDQLAQQQMQQRFQQVPMGPMPMQPMVQPMPQPMMPMLPQQGPMPMQPMMQTGPQQVMPMMPSHVAVSDPQVAPVPLVMEQDYREQQERKHGVPAGAQEQAMRLQPLPGEQPSPTEKKSEAPSIEEIQRKADAAMKMADAAVAQAAVDPATDKLTQATKEMAGLEDQLAKMGPPPSEPAGEGDAAKEKQK